MHFSARTQGIDDTPGFPRANPCLSFWLQLTRSSPLHEHRTTETIPDKADVTIIGSGLSGAATAYFLLTTGPEDKRPKSVLLLEARDACDGATARNGGHCRPDCYRDYRQYKADFGQEQALKIIQNEKDTLDLTEEIIAKEGIHCDFWRGATYGTSFPIFPVPCLQLPATNATPDVAMDQSVADALAASYAEFSADGGPVEGVVTPILDPAQARAETRCPGAAVAYKSASSGSLFPRKLVLHLLKLCIEKHGMNLQTHTPVRRVTGNENGNAGAWRVETDRGAVETQKVVYATNAFTATLLPEFLGHIYPFRGQCAAVVPPMAYAGKSMLPGTYAMVHYHLARPGIFADYLIQRPDDGVIIFGGQRASVPAEDLRGNTDDTVVDARMAAALRDALPRHFAGWPKGDEGEGKGKMAHGEGMVHVWTGIMGYTTEGIPYVGELHDKPGAFICAGHHGHGMARIMTCAKGLAALIQGESWESTGLPECFQPTRERLARPAHRTVYTVV
ncbi:FAD dependent oxidoreductase [Mycena sanguinolenta]|nr:FAD dependent oxidoreductase [Mycena sanguinolenta]